MVPHALKRELLHAGIRVLRPHDVELELLLERQILLRLRHHPTRQSKSKNPQIETGGSEILAPAIQPLLGLEAGRTHQIVILLLVLLLPLPLGRGRRRRRRLRRLGRRRGAGVLGGSHACLRGSAAGPPEGPTGRARVGFAALRGEPPPVACGASEAAEGKGGSALPVLCYYGDGEEAC